MIHFFIYFICKILIINIKLDYTPLAGLYRVPFSSISSTLCLQSPPFRISQVPVTHGSLRPGFILDLLVFTWDSNKGGPPVAITAETPGTSTQGQKSSLSPIAARP